jgi:hypothetical protein
LDDAADAFTPLDALSFKPNFAETFVAIAETLDVALRTDGTSLKYQSAPAVPMTSETSRRVLVPIRL